MVNPTFLRKVNITSNNNFIRYHANLIEINSDFYRVHTIQPLLDYINL